MADIVDLRVDIVDPNRITALVQIIRVLRILDLIIIETNYN